VARRGHRRGEGRRHLAPRRAKVHDRDLAAALARSARGSARGSRIVAAAGRWWPGHSPMDLKTRVETGRRRRAPHTGRRQGPSVVSLPGRVCATVPRVVLWGSDQTAGRTCRTCSSRGRGRSRHRARHAQDVRDALSSAGSKRGCLLGLSRTSRGGRRLRPRSWIQAPCPRRRPATRSAPSPRLGARRPGTWSLGAPRRLFRARRASRGNPLRRRLLPRNNSALGESDVGLARGRRACTFDQLACRSPGGLAATGRSCDSCARGSRLAIASIACIRRAARFQFHRKDDEHLAGRRT
jgi:hypothetical protein